MRRKLLLAFSLALAAAPALSVHAQSQGDDDARRRAQADADRKKKEKEKEWSTPQAELPTIKNAGPCPYVKVLYDASRYQEFKGRESAGTAGFTGEIQGVDASCQYKGEEPIHMVLAVNFALGRGPQAQGAQKDYHYWVAVTERNKAIIAKEEFTVRGDFPAGMDRINVVDRLQDISIPRAKASVSGGNFEVLVGFDVTPEMADFNRQGKRFRVNAAAVNTASAAAPSTTR